MSRAWMASLCLGLLASGCGEDKNYGDPLEDPLATNSALGAITNAQNLPLATTNDSALFAVNGLSGNFNLMTGAKANAGFEDDDPQDPQTSAALRVDEACLERSGNTTTYIDCDFAGTIVNGTLTIDGTEVDLSARFVSSSEDTTQTTDVDVDMTVSETTLAGSVDFDLEISSDDFSVDATFDGDFAVELADGCAVAGELEVHAVASARGQRQSVWAKADYGPDCQTVVVR